MTLRLSDLTVRIAFASLLSLIVIAILGILLVAARHQTVAKHTEVASRTESSKNLRSRLSRMRIQQCSVADAVCIARQVQLQAIGQELTARSMETELDYLQLEAYADSNEHRIRTLWANYSASWILLAMVVAIVGIGLYMSFLQLRRDLVTGQPNTNSIRISKDGLEINSPVIGLLIFVASTYFFTLYVEKIYPVTFLSEKPAEVKVGPKSAEPSASASGR